jgi:heme/copper-type cytochrome/quinol oxidase subunit 3
MTTLVATRKQRGMFIFLAADFVVFLVLFIGYIYLRRQAPLWPDAFHFPSGLMAAAMTLFALSGSFAMFYSAQHQLKDSFEIAMRLIVATIAVLGSVLILLAMEWVRLIAIVEVTFTANPWNVPAFSSTYFALTGFYALHLLIGIIYLGIVASRIRNSDAGAAALFVHFTNLVWLILFFGLYMASADLQGI